MEARLSGSILCTAGRITALLTDGLESIPNTLGRNELCGLQGVGKALINEVYLYAQKACADQGKEKSL